MTSTNQSYLNCDIVYINLEGKVHRRISMEEKLGKFFNSNEYSRFVAMEGDDRGRAISKSELGCFLSHQTIIENSSQSRYTLVLEDDVVFARNFKFVLNNLITYLDDQTEWDIFFLAQMTSINNIKANISLINLKNILSLDPERQEYRILDAVNFYISSCSSYIINPKSKNKLIDVLKWYATNNYPLAIDIALKREIQRGTIKSKFIFPYITGVENKGDTSIQMGDKLPGSRLLEDILNLFFVDADVNHIYKKHQYNQELIEKNKVCYVYSQLLFNQMLLNLASIENKNI